MRWIFRGFWQGEGQIAFEPGPEGVVVEGYEEIRPRGLLVFAALAERLFLERRFRAI